MYCSLKFEFNLTVCSRSFFAAQSSNAEFNCFVSNTIIQKRGKKIEARTRKSFDFVLKAILLLMF